MNPDTTLPKTKKIQVYTALLTQTGTDNPTATVLQNTLENVTINWTRATLGVYVSLGTFDVTKTTVTVCKNKLEKGFTASVEPTGIYVVTSANNTVGADGVLNRTFVEIKIYNL